MARLVTLSFSHYNERARWALDLAGVGYTERAYMPGFSQFGVMAATLGRGGRSDRVSTRWSTPVLFTDDGRRLADSGDIVAYACEQGLDLREDPAVADWEARFHDELGPHTRRMAYSFALRDPDLLKSMADDNVGPAQAWLFKRLYPLAAARLQRGLKIDEAGVARSRAKIDAVFDDVAEAIADGGYIVGDRFTAADLTFACMAAPALLPRPEDGFGAVFPEVEALEDQARTFVEEARAHPAGQHALRMFREHRR